MFRMRVQTIRSLLWLGNLVVFLGIVFVLGHIILEHRKNTLTDWLDNKEITRAASQVGTIVATSRGSGLQNWNEYRNLWELNVTGKDPEPDPSELASDDTAVEQTPMKPITDVLEVVFCVAWAKVDRETGRIIPGEYEGAAEIHYLEDGDRAAPGGGIPTVITSGRMPGVATSQPPNPAERHKPQVDDTFIGPGDTLRPPYDGAPFFGKVVSINPDGVVFHWGGEEVLVETPKMADVTTKNGVQIMAGVDEYGNPVPGVKLEPPAVDPAKRISRPIGAHGWYIGLDEVERIRENYESLVEEIGVKNQFVKDENGNGKLRLVLTSVPEGSLAFQRGFRDGDVLRSVNGEEIQSKASVVNYFKNNPDKGTYRIEIQRKGAILVKTFSVAR